MRISRVHFKGPKHGFSMVELLLAAFILGVALLGLAALMTVSVAQGGSSRKRGTAALLAHSLLDRIQAEGALSAAERNNSGTGAITTTDWYFIDPVGFSAHTSAAGEAAKNGYGTYDIQGTFVPATDPNKIFTVTWQRLAGDSANFSINAAQQYYIVNVSWQEVNPQTPTTPMNKTISVSRYVRL
ncbi:type IV pilus modification PilV family protein [Geothrix fuzhouensis]|uniref:type IV pilus modification PilV family protein n=1 Tax=Geothrix fuzhouensis TaxID=2966451 RepID=UPI0021498435|nr:prepilin-type N-terminal cleavage/methylation domain-containing protein [Geothrix fuzhouensis]